MLKASNRIQPHSRRTICTSFSFEFSFKQLQIQDRGHTWLSHRFFQRQFHAPSVPWFGAQSICSVRTLKILGTEKKLACLDMPWVGRDSYIPNSRETLGTHRRSSRDFQGTRFSHLRARQDSLAIQSVPIEIFDSAPAYHLSPVNTEDGRFNFTRQEEESPSCFADRSIQSVPSKILDGSPVRHSSIRTVSVSMLFTIGVSFIESAVMHETNGTHIFRLICLRQTKSSHRIILRDRATGKMGLNDQEQRRNGNPFMILVSIGNLAAFSNKQEKWWIAAHICLAHLQSPPPRNANGPTAPY